jgi:thiamine biosynthesis lipoprotein
VNALMNTLAAHAQPLDEQVRARPLLGTIVEIAAYGPSDTARAAIARAFDAVAHIHALMSYHDPASDVSRINREASANPVVVDPHTHRVLTAASEVAEASEGLFDITVAGALSRLGFLPRHSDFPRMSRHGNYRHVELLPGNRVRLARNVRIDLSGIAKGYAVDLAIQALRKAGMGAGRVNAGGDLRVFGDIPQTVHVRRPRAPTRMIRAAQLGDGAVATSAGYFAARRHRGQSVAPLIDPRTRDPIQSARSVTVIAEACLTADALTKVVHADPTRAAAVLAHFQARALVIEEDADGTCYLFDSSAAETSRGKRRSTESDHA